MGELARGKKDHLHIRQSQPCSTNCYTLDSYYFTAWLGRKCHVYQTSMQMAKWENDHEINVKQKQ